MGSNGCSHLKVKRESNMPEKFFQFLVLTLLSCMSSQAIAQQTCTTDQAKPQPKSQGMPQGGSYDRTCHWCELSEPNKGTTSLTCCCAQPNGIYQINHQEWPSNGPVPKSCENTWGNLGCSK